MFLYLPTFSARNLDNFGPVLVLQCYFFVQIINEFLLQYTLLTEIREFMVPEDRARFDELVYRRGEEPVDHHNIKVITVLIIKETHLPILVKTKKMKIKISNSYHDYLLLMDF